MRISAFILAAYLGLAGGYDSVAATKGDIVKELSRKPGSIRFKSRVKDFKQVERGEVLIHEFKFKNVGSGELIIQGVHASCGCTASEVDTGKIYSPGEEGSLRVEFDTSDFQGLVNKSLTVLTNQKSRSVRILTVRANVKNHIKVNPPLIDFEEIHTGISSHRRVEISALKGKQFEVTGVKHSKDLHVQLENDGKGRWFADVYINPTDPGDLKDVLKVETTLKSLPSVTIPIVGSIRGKIGHSPKYIEFGAVRDKRVRKKVLKLEGINHFKVLDAVVNMEVNGQEVDSKEYISLKLSEDADHTHKMKIEIHNKDHLSGSVYGDIELLTDHPNHKTIKVDFFAFFQE